MAAVEPLGDEAHHRPAPPGLVALRRERRHVVGPPQALERHHDVVAADLGLAQALHRRAAPGGRRTAVAWPRAPGWRNGPRRARRIVRTGMLRAPAPAPPC